MRYECPDHATWEALHRRAARQRWATRLWVAAWFAWHVVVPPLVAQLIG